MVFRWKYLGLVVILAGCFQQAGESLQPASSTSTPAASTSDITNDNAEPTENNSDLSSESSENSFSTPTFPPITVISPQDITPFATVTPLVASTATPLTSETGNDIPITQQVITPISPLMADVEAESTPDPNAPTLPASTDLGVDVGGGESTEEALTSPNTISSTNDSGCTYTVEPGDNLYRIAIVNNFSLDEMRTANPDLVGDAPVLQPGQILQLPSCGDTETVDVPQPTEPAGVISTTSPNQTPVGSGQGQTYTVQRGDTLLAIANRFGVTVRDLVDANNIGDPNRLAVGQVIIIPA